MFGEVSTQRGLYEIRQLPRRLRIKVLGLGCPRLDFGRGFSNSRVPVSLPQKFPINPQPKAGTPKKGSLKQDCHMPPERLKSGIKRPLPGQQVWVEGILENQMEKTLEKKMETKLAEHRLHQRSRNTSIQVIFPYPTVSP